MGEAHSYFVGELVTIGRVTNGRKLGEVVAEGPNNALDLARIRWPDAGEIYVAPIDAKAKGEAR